MPRAPGWVPLFVAGVLGVLAGYASVALALVGWVLVPILSFLVIAWLKFRLKATGVYLTLLGATGSAILMRTVIGSQPCSNGSAGPGSPPTCYASSSIPALVVLVVIAAFGLVMLVTGFIRAGSTKLTLAGRDSDGQRLRGH